MAPVFEDWSRSWLRANRGTSATQIGTWWGNATNQLRRTGERGTEEIDAVGALRNPVTLAAECKWTNRPVSTIVMDLDDYKIRALREAGFRVAERPKIILFSKAGYTDGLRQLAEDHDHIELVEVVTALTNTRESTVG